MQKKYNQEWKNIIKSKNRKRKCIIDLLYYKTPEVDLEIDVTVVINPHYEEGVKQMKTNYPETNIQLHIKLSN